MARGPHRLVSSLSVITLVAALAALLSVAPEPLSVAEAGTREAGRAAPGKRRADLVREAKLTAEAQRQFQSPDAVLAWINNYRNEPEPAKVPEAVKAMARLGLFAEPERAGVYFGFLGGIIADNQVRARELIASFFPLRPEHQIGVIRAIAASGLPEWKDLLGHFAERMPARRGLVAQYLSGKLKPLNERKLEESPEVLDSHWGFYFATGSHQSVLRIIAALALAEDKNSLEKLTVGSMAKWTLATNAQREKDLLDLARAELKHQPKDVKKPLAEVVSAAENFETAKLRKNALTAIEQLRTKGPEATRTWVWWGTAAQTAIAVGCVALSVVGVPEAGIPCIIGGAMATGATKLLAPTFDKPQ